MNIRHFSFISAVYVVQLIANQVHSKYNSVLFGWPAFRIISYL
jgi:hypothetical protein